MLVSHKDIVMKLCTSTTTLFDRIFVSRASRIWNSEICNTSSQVLYNCPISPQMCVSFWSKLLKNPGKEKGDSEMDREITWSKPFRLLNTGIFKIRQMLLMCMHKYCSRIDLPYYRYIRLIGRGSIPFVVVEFDEDQQRGYQVVKRQKYIILEIFQLDTQTIDLFANSFKAFESILSIVSILLSVLD